MAVNIISAVNDIRSLPTLTRALKGFILNLRMESVTTQTETAHGQTATDTLRMETVAVRAEAVTVRVEDITA